MNHDYFNETLLRDLKKVRAETLEAGASLSKLTGQQTLLLILRESPIFKQAASRDVQAELRVLLVDVAMAIDAKVRQ